MEQSEERSELREKKMIMRMRESEEIEMKGDDDGGSAIRFQ